MPRCQGPELGGHPRLTKQSLGLPGDGPHLSLCTPIHLPAISIGKGPVQVPVHAPLRHLA